MPAVGKMLSGVMYTASIRKSVVAATPLHSSSLYVGYLHPKVIKINNFKK